MPHSPAKDSSLPPAHVEGQEIHLCPGCGQVHQWITLHPHEVSRCVRCDQILARTLPTQHRATLAWTVTGLVLAVPSLLIPLASVSRLGNHHDGLLLSSSVALAVEMPLLSFLVLLCGVIAPFMLLALMTAILQPLVFGRPSVRLLSLLRIVHFCLEWSMPEVQLLAVLVAFIKLGALVKTDIGAGLWCYAGLSLTLIIASRRFVVADIAARIHAAQRPTP